MKTRSPPSSRSSRSTSPKSKEGEQPTPEQLETANAELGEAGRVQHLGAAGDAAACHGQGRVRASVGRQRASANLRAQAGGAGRSATTRGVPVETAESGWKLFQLLDHGDFVGVEGYLFVTKTGELSVHVERYSFSRRRLLPMPDKLHGINDPEIRQRQRYADLIASSLKVKTDEEAEAQPELSTREVFERRSKLISEMRRYLDDHGYIEVETPMLTPIASGAAARPFKTHHNALDIDLYAPHRARTLSKAAPRRRLRARLRAEPQLPQRRHRPPATTPSSPCSNSTAPTWT